MLTSFFNLSENLKENVVFLNLYRYHGKTEFSITDNHKNHESNGAMAGINVTSYLTASNILGNMQSI
jgi:hypothetical protein